MKNTIVSFAFILLPLFLLSQNNRSNEIVELTAPGKVKIGLGVNDGVTEGDIFQVFGRGQIIHPATGKLIERDNIYIGRIEIIEVNDLISFAKVIESQSPLKIGFRVIKVDEQKVDPIERKKPLQYAFKKPKESNYSETFYNKKNRSFQTGMKISDIKEVNKNELSVVVSNGDQYKMIKELSEYIVLLPELDSSVVTGNSLLAGSKRVGVLTILEKEPNQSIGKVILEKEVTDYQFFIDHNRLKILKEIEFKLGTGIGMLRGGGIVPISLGIDWYPNFTIDWINNRIWFGAGIEFEIYTDDYSWLWEGGKSNIPEFTLPIEVGYNILTRDYGFNKKFYAGIRLYITISKKVIRSFYGNGDPWYNEYYGTNPPDFLRKINIGPTLFCGYQLKSPLFFEIETGGSIHYDVNIYDEKMFLPTIKLKLGVRF